MCLAFASLIKIDCTRTAWNVGEKVTEARSFCAGSLQRHGQRVGTSCTEAPGPYPLPGNVAG